MAKRRWQLALSGASRTQVCISSVDNHNAISAGGRMDIPLRLFSNTIYLMSNWYERGWFRSAGVSPAFFFYVGDFAKLPARRRRYENLQSLSNWVYYVLA